MSTAARRRGKKKKDAAAARDADGSGSLASSASSAGTVAAHPRAYAVVHDQLLESMDEDQAGAIGGSRAAAIGRSILFVMIVSLAVVVSVGVYRAEMRMEDMHPAVAATWMSVRDFRDTLASSLPTFEPTAEPVGRRLSREENMTLYHPVVIVPGVISTGLEVWESKPCMQAFRKRIWGTTTMVQNILLNTECWLQHMGLGPGGSDPDGIKIRPAQGLEAADYFLGGFWVWGRIVESLAEIGGDPNSIFMAPYDWRLSPQLLQKRDAYFSKLKSMVELAKSTNRNRKVVLIAHSFGAIVLNYFLQWVESDMGGGGGDTWVDTYLESIIHIGGTFLGAPKTLSMLLSGESDDTAQLWEPLAYLRERVLSLPDVSKMLRSFPSVGGMMPYGGSAVWGSLGGGAPDGEEYSAMLRVNGTGLDIDGVVDLFRKVDAEWARLTERFYNFNLAKTLDEVEAAKRDPRSWPNPLRVPLPRAPNLRMYCLYGVGIDTERGYSYKVAPETSGVPYVIDVADTVPGLRLRGVTKAPGDGTVPLVSLGAMCSHAWTSKETKPRFNPHGVRVIAREYEHKVWNRSIGDLSIDSFRGGPTTADHVNMLGSSELIEDILRIASARSSKDSGAVEPRLYSNIVELTKKIKWD